MAAPDHPGWAIVEERLSERAGLIALHHAKTRRIGAPHSTCDGGDPDFASHDDLKS